MAKIPECHPDRKHYGKGQCAPCYRRTNRVAIYQCGQDWRKNNPDRYRQIQLRTLSKRAGVTQEQITILTKIQNGCCAICKEPAKLYRDHNHQTGKFRGLLCHFCNTGIGSLKDNPIILRAAIRYLNHHEKTV